MAELSKQQKLALIYKHTHRDFKGEIEGEPTILVFRNGTCLIRLADMTDAEIEDRVQSALRKKSEYLARALSN